ncbi:MipA/OmpV family protein [Yoonia sp. BS5-3]|uniref:MipA/OmpV family protein n=1 Tax=Yoonia phaeophyticola TaxID=3137369 RepID=A0ABZ2V4N6_9RHOB
MRHLKIVAITALPAFVADAQELGWSYSVMAGAEYEPSYVGSDTYVAGPGFNVTADYAFSEQMQLSLSLGGVEAAYRLTPDSTILVSLEYEPGRDNADDEILAGFAEMEDTWEIQALAFREFGPLDVGVGLQQDLLGRGKGLVGFAGVRAEVVETERFELTAGANASFGDATHMNTEVGISAAAAAATGLDEYEADGGYKSMTLTLDADYAITDRTSVFASALVESYGAAIADSPLVRDEGSDITAELGIGVSFDF